MKNFQELSYIFFAVLFSVWLIEKLKHSDKYLQRLFNDMALNLRMEKEFFENTNRCNAIFSVAKCNEKVIFHLTQDRKPLF